MELNEYQNKALETAIYDDTNPISYCVLGMCGEAGEIANKYKKVLRGDKDLTPELKHSMIHEVGDVLWYCAAISNVLGYTLQEVCDMNVEKLNHRRKNGSIQGDGDTR